MSESNALETGYSIPQDQYVKFKLLGHIVAGNLHLLPDLRVLLRLDNRETIGSLLCHYSSDLKLRIVCGLGPTTHTDLSTHQSIHLIEDILYRNHTADPSWSQALNLWQAEWYVRDSHKEAPSNERESWLNALLVLENQKGIFKSFRSCPEVALEQELRKTTTTPELEKPSYTRTCEWVNYWKATLRGERADDVQFIHNFPPKGPSVFFPGT
jgi:hypothetical protein